MHVKRSSTVMTAFIELASPKTLPTVFAVSSFAWTLGSFVAPGIGGFLAEPAEQYPAIFRDTIWERYPYALPGVVVSLSIRILVVSKSRGVPKLSNINLVGRFPACPIGRCGMLRP